MDLLPCASTKTRKQPRAVHCLSRRDAPVVPAQLICWDSQGGPEGLDIQQGVHKTSSLFTLTEKTTQADGTSDRREALVCPTTL
eukprot:763161-Hanusia_phi.AAC.2